MYDSLRLSFSTSHYYTDFELHWSILKMVSCKSEMVLLTSQITPVVTVRFNITILGKRKIVYLKSFNQQEKLDDQWLITMLNFFRKKIRITQKLGLKRLDLNVVFPTCDFLLTNFTSKNIQVMGVLHTVKDLIYLFLRKKK